MPAKMVILGKRCVSFTILLLPAVLGRHVVCCVPFFHEQFFEDDKLVGGFNPSEKYASKLDHFPKDRGEKKNI